VPAQPNRDVSKPARYWLLTIPEADWSPFGPQRLDFATFVAYCRGQLEVGAANGFRHWQVCFDPYPLTSRSWLSLASLFDDLPSRRSSPTRPIVNQVVRTPPTPMSGRRTPESPTPSSSSVSDLSSATTRRTGTRSRLTRSADALTLYPATSLFGITGTSSELPRYLPD